MSVDTFHSLSELEGHDDFTQRHIGPDELQITSMLNILGFSELEQLMDAVVPEVIRSKKELQLDPVKSEREISSYIRDIAGKNKVFINMIGMGYYGTVMPQVIKRNLLEHPGWYTAYTPYQAEISQGRLEALLNFQQMITDLTAMELANASLLDEGTAAAEAMIMSRRLSKKKNSVFLVDKNTHPQTISVIKTRAESLGIDIVLDDPWITLSKHDVFGVLLSYPGSNGEIKTLKPAINFAKEQEAYVIVTADLLSLVLLEPPGEQGADIVVGSAQRFGVSLGYGGPHAAFFATLEKYKRAVPGRIIGVSKDKEGRQALRMTLQTREQHIRRDNATSNICTAQVLLAIISGMYAVYHGREGLKLIANRVHRMTLILVAGLNQLGISVVNNQYFDTVTLYVPGMARRFAAKAKASRINLRIVDADHLGISFDETTRRKELLVLWRVFDSHAAQKLDIQLLDKEFKECLSKELRRNSSFLTHPVFKQYHSETEMLRYLNNLVNKDISLDRSMIPLGSCTMKLNAATEMETLSSRSFSAIHPFAPLEQAQGYHQLFDELEQMLCEITGFNAISFQPNAGSQGEYAGLLVIKKYHHSRGETQRDVCLIPASAHGTNPASAVLAGLRVVVVACEDNGNVSVDDLKAKADQFSDKLAALMITYPSTHGVYEESIVDICEVIHKYSGQIYLDGANLNALVGIARPAEFGADVAHINLHKTFCIPHGGGGPGMGPIGVKEHLLPFLPDHPVIEGVNPAADVRGTIGTVSAAPWSSASILTISWAYIAMMGADGLKRATQLAILNTNYIANRLEDYFPILYTGKNNRVAHECIIDIRPIKLQCGVTAEDIAKRLVDYGFHAPTMSFPVPDTLMIEPTESENKIEIDHFCDAMISIHMEITEIIQGTYDQEDNLLKNAPHSPTLLLEDEWKYAYSKQAAFYPLPNVQYKKYWPPVSRIDNLYGDKNLICTCPPLEIYETHET